VGFGCGKPHSSCSPGPELSLLFPFVVLPLGLAVWKTKPWKDRIKRWWSPVWSACSRSHRGSRST
jgi:hypothetical protein